MSKSQYKELSEDLVESLDLVYVTAAKPGQNLDGLLYEHVPISICGREMKIVERLGITYSSVSFILGDPYTEISQTIPVKQRPHLSDFKIFAALMGRYDLEGSYPIPVFSRGDPVSQLCGNETVYLGIPGHVSQGYMKLRSYNPIHVFITIDGQILARETRRGDEEAIVSFLKIFGDIRGNRDAILLDKPVSFNTKNRLILARSPNGSVDLSDCVKEIRLKEGEKETSTEKYVLVYTNLDELRQGRRWAKASGERLLKKYNRHLDEDTKE